MKAENLAALLMGLGSNVSVPPSLDGPGLSRKAMGADGYQPLRHGIPKARPKRTATARKAASRRDAAKASRKRNRR